MAARILIVEDNPANLKLMSYLVKAFGHNVLAAHDGEEALEVVRRQSLDLIVCDIQLPKFDGYEVARQLKNHPALRRIPLVAVTALAMVGDRDKVLAAGFDGYIAKPIVPQTFVKQLEAFLDPDLNASPAPPAPPTTVQATPATPNQRGTILALDNMPVNLKVLSSTLEPVGYTLLTAQRVQDALAIARQTAVDLIIADVHLARESGFDFLKAVQADSQLQSIPFVFLSSTMAPEKDRETALALGAAKMIVRPIEPQALLAEIANLLGRRTE